MQIKSNATDTSLLNLGCYNLQPLSSINFINQHRLVHQYVYVGYVYEQPSYMVHETSIEHSKDTIVFGFIDVIETASVTHNV